MAPIQPGRGGLHKACWMSSGCGACSPGLMNAYEEHQGVLGDRLHRASRRSMFRRWCCTARTTRSSRSRTQRGKSAQLIADATGDLLSRRTARPDRHARRQVQRRPARLPAELTAIPRPVPACVSTQERWPTVRPSSQPTGSIRVRRAWQPRAKSRGRRTSTFVNPTIRRPSSDRLTLRPTVRSRASSSAPSFNTSHPRFSAGRSCRY